MSFAGLLALIAPPACVACRVPLTVTSALVCPGCMRALRWLGPDVCRRCGLPTHGGRPCPALTAPFASAWAPFAHHGTARALVRALKFDGALPVAGLMAAQMAANVPPWALGRPRAAAHGGLQRRDELGIVAVPPARARHRARGFDPAALLAAGLATRLELPVVECLRRSGRASRQLGARREQRRAPGRIRVTATRPPPARVLLVDDVHTTGATLAACARVLTAQGAVDVRALSYVRAL